MGGLHKLINTDDRPLERLHEPEPQFWLIPAEGEPVDWSCIDLYWRERGYRALFGYHQCCSAL